jgi:hypothetical protein
MKPYRTLKAELMSATHHTQPEEAPTPTSDQSNDDIAMQNQAGEGYEPDLQGCVMGFVSSLLCVEVWCVQLVEVEGSRTVSNWHEMETRVLYIGRTL